MATNRSRNPLLSTRDPEDRNLMTKSEVLAPYNSEDSKAGELDDYPFELGFPVCYVKQVRVLPLKFKPRCHAINRDYEAENGPGIDNGVISGDDFDLDEATPKDNKKKSKTKNKVTVDQNDEQYLHENIKNDDSNPEFVEKFKIIDKWVNQVNKLGYNACKDK